MSVTILSIAAFGLCVVRVFKVLNEAGVPDDRIMFLNVVSCPEGIAAMTEAHPGVKIVTAAIDERLDGKKYIVPGCGDYGDRYFNTV